MIILQQNLRILYTGTIYRSGIVETVAHITNNDIVAPVDIDELSYGEFHRQIRYLVLGKRI